MGERTKAEIYLVVNKCFYYHNRDEIFVETRWFGKERIVNVCCHFLPYFAWWQRPAPASIQRLSSLRRSFLCERWQLAHATRATPSAETWKSPTRKTIQSDIWWGKKNMIFGWIKKWIYCKKTWKTERGKTGANETWDPLPKTTNDKLIIIFPDVSGCRCFL